jgi:membrane protease YdiL (CAAX protease family)
MPLSPVQIAVAVFELALVFAGGGLLLTILLSVRQRQRWLATHALPYWPLSVSEFVILAGLVMSGMFLSQTVIQLLFKARIAVSPDKAGLEIFVYGAAAHGGVLLACLAFPHVLKQFQPNLGTEPPPLRQAPALPWTQVLRYAGGTLLVVLPVVALLSLGWNLVLQALGLPDAPQDLVKIFAATESRLVILGMFFVACVLAPLSEELVFRAGIYRYIRQKLGRMPAMLASGLLFGALHGSWTGAIPLAGLGMLLALVYEATGSIRVSILVHALFNLNTILIVLSGLAEVAS